MAPNSTDRPPNILFILADQLRADFLSCYGAGFIDTSHIDGIAAAGIRYERAYSASPLCVPARTALLTGMSAARTGVADNLHALRPDYRDAGIRTWPELLAKAGYHTAAIGKMHFYPWDAAHGFGQRVACEDKLWPLIRDDYTRYLEAHGLAKLRWSEYGGYLRTRGAATTDIPWRHSCDRFTGREACRFIERNAGEETPWALMVGFPGPHDPYDPARDFPVRYRDVDMPPPVPAAAGDPGGLREAHGRQRAGMGMPDGPLRPEESATLRSHYAGLVKGIDYEVGVMLAALRDSGQVDDTVVIFTSDHGDLLGDHGMQGKGNFFEGSMRIPLVAQGPGIGSGTDHPGLVELRDVTASMLRIAGAEQPAHMDARPLPGLGADSGGRSEILGVLAGAWVAFDGTWKLCKYHGHAPVLFNLADDPDELADRAGDPAAARKLLRLDTLLTAEVMAGTDLAMHDRLVSPYSLANDEPFGRPGWSWRYPAPIAAAIQHTGGGGPGEESKYDNR
jgi:arylsulfatase A-like enzyme